MAPIPRPFEVRFWEKVKKTETCWIWTAYINKCGYGQIATSRCTSELAHRAAWKLLRGEIPVNLEIDHLCRVRECVNPDHMELVTSAVNVLRGEGPPAKNARKTHCIHGHPLSGNNLSVSKRQRWCKRCKVLCPSHQRTLKINRVTTGSC